MSGGSPWEPKIKLMPWTFWLRPSRVGKLKAILAIAVNPVEVIGRVKRATEDEIDRLYEEGFEKQAPNSHP